MRTLHCATNHGVDGRAMAMFALAMALVATSARADGRDESKVYFNAGAEAFEAGQFLAAIQAFERAEGLAPHPAIVFSIAQAEKHQFYVDQNPDRARRAIAQYRAYLDQVPQGGRRADAAQAIGELEARLIPTASRNPPAPVPAQTRVVVSSSHTKNARIALDGKPATGSPLIQEVAPGPHTVTISADGYFDEQRDLVAVEGGLVALDAPLRGKPAKLAIAGPTGATVAIDDRPAGVLPLPVLGMAAGRHFVAVGQNGRKPWSSEIELERGEARALRVDLGPTAQRRAAYSLLGVSAAGVVTSGVFAGLALRQQSISLDIEAESKMHNIDAARSSDHDRALERRDTFRSVAWISLGISAGIAATGLVLYFVDPPEVASSTIDREPQRPKLPPPSPDFSLAPFVAPGIAGLAAVGRM